MEKKHDNYEETIGKHPIPHAEGIAKGETSDLEKQNKKSEDKKSGTKKNK